VDRVSGETSVTFCIALRRAEIVGEMIQDQRERKRERERVRERRREDKTDKAKRMLGTSPILRYVLIANSTKVFKCLTVERVRGRTGIR
jgi:hypothetical protein